MPRIPNRSSLMPSLLLRNCDRVSEQFALQRPTQPRPGGPAEGHRGKIKRTVDLSLLDRIADSLGALAIDLAADAEGGAQDLLDAPLEVLGEGLELHRPRNVDDLVERHRLVVLDVLLLLAVAGGLLERP